MNSTIIREGVARATPSPQQKLGVSLIELLIAMAVIAIMATFGVINYNSWRQRENFRENQRSLVGAINEARSQSRRMSVNQTITWESKGANLLLSHNGETQTLTNINLQDVNTQDTKGDLVFTAPFGRRGTAIRQRILIKDDKNRQAMLVIYGVTGKTQLLSCPRGGGSPCP